MIKFIGILILVVGCKSLLNDNQDEELNTNKEPSYYRLPTNTIPLNYTLVLKATLDESTFQGHTTIRIKCISDTDQVVLHTNNLNVTSTSVTSLSGSNIAILNTTYSDDDRHFFTITLNETLVEGQECELEFEYNAPFTKRWEGLYKGSYITSDRTKKPFAVTQFEATFARQAFPCFDEPALKAVFDIHIYAPEGYHSLSNMDVITSNQPLIKGYECTSFRSSPPMSTYLVAFAVSDFEYKSNTKDGEAIFPKEFRVYAKPCDRDALDYLLDFGQRSILYIQNYTGVDYRLPKVDNIALPDIWGDAMENWGLITYREVFALNIKGTTTSHEKYQLISYSTHEISHFWFGNEVSPLWWDYLWLNEGFATFFQLYVTDKLINEGGTLMNEFVVYEIQDTMKTDSKPDTNAMSSPVGSPSEIASKLGVISYDKSMAVIRMIHHVLGEQVFQSSLSTYLKSLPMSNADPQKLFSEMQKVVGQTNILPENVTLADIFGSWSEQPGYPVIEVSKESNTSLRVVQNRFYSNSSISSNQTWWIPLTWTTDDDPDFENTTTQAWMSPSTSEITLPTGSKKWIIFNKQQCGYYRVMYSMEMWNDLVNVLNSDDHHIIHPLNKAYLINDAMEFSKTDRFSVNITFDILNYLSRETNWIPWMRASVILSFFNRIMIVSPKYDLYKEFVSSIIKTVYDSVGITANDDDDYATRMKRYSILKLACDIGMKHCLKAAHNKLEKSLRPDSEPLDPDLKSIIYCFGIRHGSKSLWNETFAKYEKVSSESEQLLIINGLGCSQDNSIVDSYLDMMFANQSADRLNTRAAAISLINAGPFGIGKLLNFIKDHFYDLNGFNSLNTFTSKLAESILIDEHVEMFNNLVETYNNNPEMLDSLPFKIKVFTLTKFDWKQNHIHEIEAWLVDNVKKNIHENLI